MCCQQQCQNDKFKALNYIDNKFTAIVITIVGKRAKLLPSLENLIYYLIYYLNILSNILSGTFLSLKFTIHLLPSKTSGEKSFAIIQLNLSINLCFKSVIVYHIYIVTLVALPRNCTSALALSPAHKHSRSRNENLDRQQRSPSDVLRLRALGDEFGCISHRGNSTGVTILYLKKSFTN